jgi:hypothetical protein
MKKRLMNLVESRGDDIDTVVVQVLKGSMKIQMMTVNMTATMIVIHEEKEEVILKMTEDIIVVREVDILAEADHLEAEVAQEVATPGTEM